MSYEILVTFRFTGPELDPDNVTSLLDIVPTEAHKKGEPLAKHPERTYPTSYWGLQSDLSQIASLAEHLNYLLAILEPKAESIKALVSKGNSCDFHCSYFVTTPGNFDKGRLELSADILSRISAVGSNLTIDFYSYDE